jgi:CheY-like chemotaxis protein
MIWINQLRWSRRNPASLNLIVRHALDGYHLNGSLTGLEVLQQVRAPTQRDVPAILLSGDLQSMMRVVKTALPNCHFLSKPVDTNALLSAIAELCPTAAATTLPETASH